MLKWHFRDFDQHQEAFSQSSTSSTPPEDPHRSILPKAPSCLLVSGLRCLFVCVCVCVCCMHAHVNFQVCLSNYFSVSVCVCACMHAWVSCQFEEHRGTTQGEPPGARIPVGLKRCTARFVRLQRPNAEPCLRKALVNAQTEVRATGRNQHADQSI